MKTNLRILTFMRITIVMAMLLAGFIAQPALALESIPEGATITSATLSLYVNIPSGAIVNVHAITSPWDEMTVTWNSFGGSFNPATVGSFTAGAAGWVSVDVTSLVQSWVNGAPNYGLLIEQGLTNYTRYLSSENGVFTNGPKLEICYGAGTCVTIQSTALEPNAVVDAYIWALNPNTNAGGSGWLYTGLVGGYEKQSLLRFDFTLTPPPPGGEGCTPGYWRNHLEDWPPTGYSTGDDFDTTFGTGYFDPDITLGQAIWLGGGGVNKLARHGTAALLSAAHPDVDYPYTVAEVIAFVQAGNVDPLVDANELGCSIP